MHENITNINNNFNKEVGAKLFRARKNKKMSRAALAEQLNLHETTIKRYEDGDIKKLDIEKMQEFANVLDIAPEYLMGWTSDDGNNSKNSSKSLLSKNLKYLREANKIDQAELANFLNITYREVRAWEVGAIEPKITVLNKLAHKWGVTLDKLVNEDLADINNTYYKSPSSDSNDEIRESVTTYTYMNKKITVYGKVYAGDGTEAFEDPIDEITNPYHRVKKELLALQVHGDSMNNVVNDSMYAIVEKVDIVNNGEIAVVLIDGDIGMLKRFYRLDESTVVLKPDSTNPIHKAMIFENEEINRLKIIGKYIGHVSPMIGD